MKICVTGGAGMIGSSLVRKLFELGHQVVVIDNFWRGRRENLAGIDQFNPGSILEIDLSESKNFDLVVKELQGCESAIHLADVVAGIGFVFNNQYDVFRINNAINTNFFHACTAAGVRRIIYAGTACSFPKELQKSLSSVLKEDQLFPAEPESAYGWSKLMGTLELRYLTEKHNVDGTTLMLHNVYGPRCDIDPARSQVIPALIRRILELGQGEPVTVWGSGNQGRAFVYVDDVVVAIVKALEKRNLPEVVQIGPGQCISIRQLVETLRDRVIKKDFEIHYDTSKPEGDLGRSADFALAQRLLEWSPRTALVDGLRITTDWINAQLEDGNS